MRREEGVEPLFYQSYDARTREPAWRWLQKNFDALAAKVPEFWASYIPLAGNRPSVLHQAHCSSAHSSVASR